MQKKFALLSLAILFILFLLCTVKACLSADKYYMQGIQFEAQEKYQDAYYNYGKINKWSKIYPLGIYKQAKCAKTIGDNKTAIKKYKKYTSIIQNDVMTPVGLWELGNLYYESAKPKDAMKIFKKLESRYPDNNYTYASFYRIGELLKDKDKQQSVAYLAKYLDYAPIGRFSKNAVQYIEKSGENITSDVKVILAKSLMQNGEYDKALNYLMAAPFDKRWIQEYRIYKAKNDETNAIKTIEEGLKLENNNITEDDIKEAINYYLLKKNTKSDIKNIYEITNIKGSKIHYYIGILYAQSLPDGYNLFSDIYKCNSKYSDIALSEMIYLDYKKGNYMSAINLGNEFYSKYKDKNTAPKALYYTAKSYDKNKDKKQAQSLYKKITDDYGRSYYAFRAFQSLNNNPSFNMISKNELPKIREIKYQFLTNDKEGFYLNKLLNYGDISTIDDFKIEDEYLKSYIAYKNKKHGYSIILARDEAEKSIITKLNKTQTSLLYPIYYEDEINKYSKMNNVSPYLMIALIRKESTFDTGAKSSAGAIGLTQILPSTASFIEKGSLKGNIENVNYNIYLGTKYFAYLKSTLNNNDMLSVASYNAGPGNVKKWLTNLKTNDYDIFVESIPFVETKSYVKKVFEAYWNYISLYK